MTDTLTIDRTHFPRLKQLWGAGLSALECGSEIGLAGDDAAVREAVLRAIEEANRPQPKVAKPPKAKPVRKTHAQRLKQAYGDDDTAFAPDNITGAPLAFDLAIPSGQRKTLLELTPKTCKWPVGDPSTPDFFFCGGPPAEGLPYCVHHCRRAYGAPPRRAA